MNREEILNMSAGREMDRLIAAHVFGIEDDGTWLWFVAPLYSTDISAAWKVVEHLRHKNYWVCVNMPMNGTGGWFFEWALGEGKIEYVTAETAPLAICRAALLAIMET